LKKFSGWSINLQDWDVVIDLGPVALCHTLGDPNDVAALLLLELEQGVEDAIVELLQESINVQLHLVFEELILECLLAGVGAGALEALLVLAVVLGNLPHLVIVIRPCKCLQTVRVQSTTRWVQLLAIILSKFSAEGVDGNDERPPVRLKGEDLAHDVRRLSADVLAEARNNAIN